MKDLFSIFGDYFCSVTEPEALGKTVEIGGKKFCLILRVPTILGAFLAIEADEDGIARFGRPVTIIQYEPTRLEDLDIQEGKNRSSFVLEVKYTSPRLQPTDYLGPRTKWEAAKKNEACADSCPAKKRGETYKGHSQKTTAKETPFLERFCPEHRILVEDYLAKNGFQSGKWPLMKKEDKE